MAISPSTKSKLKWYTKRLVLLPLAIIILNVLHHIINFFATILSLITARKQPMVVRTPEERFQDLAKFGYTFKPHYAELPIGGGKALPRVHYLDEGPEDASETILCLHGEPSWSFLYRKMIPVLVKAGYRVIVPDFIGFGKSDKYTNPERYTHDLHTMTLRLLLDKLQLSGVTLVCQDWGGLTGLSVVKDCPAVFSRLVIMNTGLPTGRALSTSFVNATPFLMWQAYARFVGTFMPIEKVFNSTLIDPEPEVVQGYTAPFPSPLHKAGAARWPLLVPVTPSCPVAGDMQATRDYLQMSWHKPALVMFSDRDPITGSQAASFMRLLPHATLLTVTKAGHFLQEDKGVEVAQNIVEFIQAHS